jgi:hypothetical protein
LAEPDLGQQDSGGDFDPKRYEVLGLGRAVEQCQDLAVVPSELAERSFAQDPALRPVQPTRRVGILAGALQVVRNQPRPLVEDPRISALQHPRQRRVHAATARSSTSAPAGRPSSSRKSSASWQRSEPSKVNPEAIVSPRPS